MFLKLVKLAFMILLVLGTLIDYACGSSAAGGNVTERLVRNGSFETGLREWCWYVRGYGGYDYDCRIMALDPQPKRVKTADAPNGRHVLKLDIPNNTWFRLSSRAIVVPKKPLKVSAWFRTSFPVTLEVADANKPRKNTIVTKDVLSAKSWKKVELTVPAATDKVSICVYGKQQGVCLMDDFRLTYAEAPPQAPVEVGFEAAALDKVFFVKDKKTFSIRAYADTAQAGSIQYIVKNAWGDKVAGGKIPAKIAAHSLFEKPLALAISDTGHYHISAQFTSVSRKLSPISESLFAIIPDRILPTSPQDGEKSHFGCNMKNRAQFVKLARQIGIRWVMCAPPLFTKWFSVEPEKGQWMYFDKEADALRNAGINILGNLADAPFWATDPTSKEHSGPWPNGKLPEDMGLWDDYVRHVTSHYNPRIRYWALWNEPNLNGYLNLSDGQKWSDEYVKLLQRTYKTVKEVDPGLKVVGGTVTHAAALGALIESGGLDCMDIAAFHFSAWSPKGYVRNTAEERGFMGVPDIRKMMEQAGKSVPLWDTEAHMTEAQVSSSFSTLPPAPSRYETPLMSPLDAAAAVPRQTISEWATGVEKTFYWALAAPALAWEPRTGRTMLEFDRSPCEPVVSYAVMTTMLSDAEFDKWEKKTDDSSLDKPTIWTFYFSKPHARLRVIWSSSDTPSDLLIPVRGKQVSVHDMFGVASKGADQIMGMDLKDQRHVIVSRYPVYVLDEE